MTVLSDKLMNLDPLDLDPMGMFDGDFDSLDFSLTDDFYTNPKGRVPPKAPPMTIYEAIPLHSPTPPGPGILTVNLMEGKDLGVPYEDNEQVYHKVSDLHKQWMPYAILEYDKCQISVEANSWGIDLVSTRRIPEHYVRWGGFDGALTLQVIVPSDLNISLFMRKLDPSGEQQIVDLGHVKLDPFFKTLPRGARRERVEGGPGTIFLTISYAEKHVLPLHDNSMWGGVQEECDPLTGLVIVEKKDTGQWYAMKTIAVAGDVSSTEMESSIRSHVDHPNIAPLQFAFKSINGLNLLSPLAGGGHLLYHLQREYRFSINRARQYAAELVETLEYLQKNRVVAGSLKPPNIFLSSSGHISLCDPGIFASTDRDEIATNTSEWSAPEFLKGQETTAAVDWWSLGSLLYEMLIGSPPFYHENGDEQRKKIISEEVQLPTSLPTAARDILSRLLDKDPARRLGANGAAEVRAHAFFHGLDVTNPYKPVDTETTFTSDPRSFPLQSGEPVITRREGDTLQMRINDSYLDKDGIWNTVGELKAQSGLEIPDKGLTDADDGWELAWDPDSRQFCLTHRLTAGRRPADPSHPAPMTGMPASKEQRHCALATALKEGYSWDVVAQILEHGVDLNQPVLYYQGQVWGLAGTEAQPYLEPSNDRIPFTPLEWATEHDDIELVKLLLSQGADANISAQEVQGPPLIRAVRKRNYRLAEVLVPRTDRITSTRALSLAVAQEDTTVVRTLLKNGVRCDFEDSDRPLPPVSSFGLPLEVCTLGENPYVGGKLGIRNFEPPLLQAARRGNLELARLLLAHGADPNAAYYGLGRYYQQYCRSEELHTSTHFCCGRYLHVALELGHVGIVRELLEAGADPSLPLPIWHARLHQCPIIPRSVYVRVAVGLKEAAERMVDEDVVSGFTGRGTKRAYDER